MKQSQDDKKDLGKKKRIFRNFIILALSFLFLGVIYIHLVVLRTKKLLSIKALENQKKKTSIHHSEVKNEYIKNFDLFKIERSAKEHLEMFFPKEVKYFKLK